MSENLFFAAEFDLLKSESVPILNLKASLYSHRKTGALHFHLDSDQSENVFLVGFRTVPTDSTGVAHILEHTALCGSERYPVRDPFFMMIRRSLNTFMNAFTSSDWTAYPFATQNRKDYFNLLDVYLDAAFFPRLDPLDFSQEGHRLEFENPTDPTSPLSFKGVVFNEMKGAMGSAASRFYQAFTQNLFEENTYHFNSGGDPAEITELTYEQLKAFHALHYHPSNSFVVTFGSISADEIQEKLHERVFSRFDALNEEIAVPLETRFTEPKYAVERYPVEEGASLEKKTALFLGWLLPESTDLATVLRAELITGLLIDNSASPLRDYLETSPLGTHPASLTGLETGTREMFWVCGLEGAEPESAAQFEKEVLTLLEEVAEKGVDPSQIEAMIHQMEMTHREIQGGAYPYGLHLILGVLPTFIHRADPFVFLDIDEALIELRREAEDPTFVGRWIRTFFLENSHRLQLTITPDPELNRREAEAEAAKLEKISAQLTDNDRSEIVAQAKALLARQAEVQADDSILPRVGIEDIPKEIEIPTGSTTSLRGTSCAYYSATTRGLVYQDVILSLPPLSLIENERLALFSSFWGELGAGELDYRSRQAQIALVSGGIGASLLYQTKRGSSDQTTGFLALSSKGLERNHASFSELVYSQLKATRFDELEHIRDLYVRNASLRERSVIGNGHQLAMLSAAATHTPLAALSHRMSGLMGIASMKREAEQLDDDRLSQLVTEMKAVYQKVTSGAQQLLLVGEESEQSQQLETLSRLFGESEPFEPSLFDPMIPLSERDQIWTAPVPVQFCAKAYRTVSEDHPDAAALRVLALVLRNGYLHRAIREQGGAYGGGAIQDGKLGVFKFFSYRDPRLMETFEDFDHSLSWIRSGEVTSQMLEEAILGVISAIDKPSTPAGEARRAFYDLLSGSTPEERREQRARVLEVTQEDLLRVTECYFDPENGRISAITSEEGARLFDPETYEICSLAKSE